MLALTNVTAGYGAFTALWDVSLRVEAREAVAVVGPNGAAKPAGSVSCAHAAELAAGAMWKYQGTKPICSRSSIFAWEGLSSRITCL